MNNTELVRRFRPQSSPRDTPGTTARGLCPCCGHQVRIELNKAYLDAKEAAAYLGVCLDSVYRYRQAGKLPGKKLGGKVLFRLADLNNLGEAS